MNGQGRLAKTLGVFDDHRLNRPLGHAPFILAVTQCNEQSFFFLAPCSGPAEAQIIFKIVFGLRTEVDRGLKGFVVITFTIDMRFYCSGRCPQDSN